MLFLLWNSNEVQGKRFQNAFEVHNEVTAFLDSLFGLSERGNLDEAHLLYKRLDKYKSKLNTPNDSFAYYYVAGNFQYKHVDIDVGFQNLFSANLVAKRSGNLEQVASSEISIGNAHYYMKDLKSAIDHYKLAAEIEEAKIGVQAAASHNIGALLFETFDHSTDQRYKDSLTSIIDLYLRKAIKLSLTDQNTGRLAATYSVIVPWFGYLKQYDSAYHYASEAMRLANQSGFPNRVNFARINMARVLVWDGKAQESLHILDSAILFFDSIGFDEQVIHAHRVKVWAYDSLGEYKLAARLADKTYNMIRATFPLKLEKSVAKYKSAYNYNKIELENKELLIENKSRKLNTVTLWLFISALLIILLSLNYWYRNKIKKQKLQFQKELIASNLNSQESEKKRIARELHDGVGQQITSIKLGLENIGENQAKTESSISELRDMVTEVLQNVRGISHQMMPVALQRFGLVKAVESLVDFMNEQGKTRYVFDSFNLNNVDVSDQVEVHVYRVIQELMTNIEKHADASQAEIQLYQQSNTLFAVVSDNGKGMDLSKKEGGIGMANIEARVSSLGGEVDIESSRDGTTTVIKIGL